MWGKLIVFEGGEGSGKTTQLARSHQWLVESRWYQLAAISSPQKVILTREPGGTQLGTDLRQLLLRTTTGEPPIQDRAELLLYAADRVQHVEAVLKPQLAQGGLILCDRYTDSTVAYQGYGRGLCLELISQLNAIATGGLESDLTLWLDLDAEIGLARVQKREGKVASALDRIEQADVAFHQRVRQGFRELAQQFPQRIVRIDAAQSEAAVAQQIQTTLSQRLNEWYPSSFPA